MGYQKLSKERQTKKRKAVDREEKRWARKSGSVQTRFVCPVCSGPHSKADHGVKDETTAAPVPRRRRRATKGVPREWTQAERAVGEDALGLERRYKRP